MAEDPGVQERVGCLMRFKVLTAGLGILMGCCAFPVFTFVFNNVQAGIWALLSVILASMVFHLHLLYQNFKLESWHTAKSLAAS